MYTILMQPDKSLVATQRVKIYQREKLADKLEFLIPSTYQDINIQECAIILKYVDQDGIVLSEQLEKDEELYKDNYVRCVVPVNTRLTRSAGNITMHLTFIHVDYDTNDADVVLHSGETVLTVLPLKDLYDHITDESLEILDQKIIKLQAGIEATNILAESIDKNKADDLSYENNTLQLMSNGQKIGTSHVLDQMEEMDVIDLDNTSDEQDDQTNNRVVEF